MPLPLPSSSTGFILMYVFYVLVVVLGRVVFQKWKKKRLGTGDIPSKEYSFSTTTLYTISCSFSLTLSLPFSQGLLKCLLAKSSVHQIPRPHPLSDHRLVVQVPQVLNWMVLFDLIFWRRRMFLMWLPSTSYILPSWSLELKMTRMSRQKTALLWGQLLAVDHTSTG